MRCRTIAGDGGRGCRSQRASGVISRRPERTGNDADDDRERDDRPLPVPIARTRSRWRRAGSARPLFLPTSRASVETPLADHAPPPLRRNQPVDGSAARSRGRSSYAPRRDIETGMRTDTGSVPIAGPLGRLVVGSFVRATRPRAWLRQAHRAGFVPGVETAGHVGTHDEAITIGGREKQRTGWCRWARRSISTSLTLMPSSPRWPRPGHRQPVGRGGHHGPPLLPRVAGHHEQHPVEAKLRMTGGRGGHGDAHCGWIEGPPNTPTRSPARTAVGKRLRGGAGHRSSVRGVTRPAMWLPRARHTPRRTPGSDRTVRCVRD